MNFQITFNDKNYCYDLGPSEIAKSACRGLEIYKRNNVYGNLRRLFAELAWIVSEGNPYNAPACSATQILALSVFPMLNCYQKFFVASSVTSIFANARRPCPADWVRAHEKYGNIVADILHTRGVDPEVFQNAGLAYLDVNTRERIVTPIPEYSI